MVLIEALSRQVPGVVGLPKSVERDSFRRGLLDHPHYTRPPVVEGREVPPVLVSGDHAAIERWRRRAALAATRDKRPDLLAAAGLDAEERRELAALEAEAAEAESPEPESSGRGGGGER
jgi:tRNA (guanine37-N1)-methyltransferase